MREPAAPSQSTRPRAATATVSTSSPFRTRCTWSNRLRDHAGMVGDDADLARRSWACSAQAERSMRAMLLAQARRSPPRDRPRCRPKPIRPSRSLVSALEPASMMARSSVGRLTTVASTVSAQSSKRADALARPGSGPCRYRCRAGARWPTLTSWARQISGVPPLEMIAARQGRRLEQRPWRRPARRRWPRPGRRPDRSSARRSRRPGDLAIFSASASAASGVCTPQRPMPVSHSTSTRQRLGRSAKVADRPVDAFRAVGGDA